MVLVVGGNLPHWRARQRAQPAANARGRLLRARRRTSTAAAAPPPPQTRATMLHPRSASSSCSSAGATPNMSDKILVLPLEKHFPDYENSRVLAAGSFGKVLSVRDVRGCRIALKVPRSWRQGTGQDSSLTRQEARHLQKAASAHAIPLLGVFAGRETPCRWQCHVQTSISQSSCLRGARCQKVRGGTCSHRYAGAWRMCTPSVWFTEM